MGREDMTIDLVKETQSGIIMVRWVRINPETGPEYHRTSYEPGDPLPEAVAAVLQAA